LPDVGAGLEGHVLPAVGPHLFPQRRLVADLDPRPAPRLLGRKALRDEGVGSGVEVLLDLVGEVAVGGAAAAEHAQPAR